MTDITLLDGSIGQELVKRSTRGATALWSTQALLDDPGLVAQVHHDYADAGATVATTNTYALHRDRLSGRSNHYAATDSEVPDLMDQFEQLLSAALDAVDPVRSKSRVAGSIGPLGASYRADLHPEPEIAIARFGEVAQFLAPRVDVLLFETIPSVQAARDALIAGRKTGKPVWLAFTVSDEDGTLLRSGEAIRDAVSIASDADAALINCSVPEAIAPALDALRACTSPIGAYANGFTRIEDSFITGGTTVDALTARKDLSPKAYADFALSWVNSGATIIGGCCEVGPDHIAELATRLRAEGHTLV